MSRPLKLEDFDLHASASPVAGHAGRPGMPAVPSDAADDREEEQLAAFEKGYGAGWEDAAKAHAEEQERISADFARALQDMSFSFHEAHAAFQAEAEALIRGLVETVLPAALEPALAAMIRDRAQALAETAEVTVEIVVAPDNVARVEGLAAGRPAPPMRVVGEDSLGAGQAFIRFGATEEKIDLDAALAELRAAVSGYLAGAPAADGHADGGRRHG
ncbi:MAG: hypothetical protein GVX90_04915 [Alphaproteobacteria bacterium]|jgi:flagellar assembly protein FliH|nr:hypothetical protein [Alphaproteobacteria bacterium]